MIVAKSLSLWLVILLILSLIAIVPSKVHFHSSNCNSSAITSFLSLLQWVQGPFVLINSCKQNSDLLDTEIQFCDGLQDLSVCTPTFVLGSGLYLKRLLGDRYALHVRFLLTSRIEASSFELKWAHFRGNTRLVPIGFDGAPLIINQGGTTVQYTHSGHLFVLVQPDSSWCNCVNDLFCSLECNIKQIVGVYLIPAVQLDCLPQAECSLDVELNPTSYPFYNVDTILELTTCPYRSVTQTAFCDPSTLTNCFRELLMTYWEHQRRSQVWVNSWAVPALPVVQESSAWCSTTAEAIAILQASDVTSMSETVPSAVPSTVSPTIQLGEPTNNLWTVKKLPAALAADLLEYHRSSRSSFLSVEEPPISLVFNQFETRTYYLPLSTPLLESLVAEAHRATAQWLGVAAEDLEVTGAYGCREYRTGAVVRWHVDPADTQPLTVIIHIADSEYAHSHSIPHTRRRWAIQVPKDLTLFHRHATSYSGTHFGGGEYEQDMHTIYLAEGEMLLLQSAKLPHARAVPYEGEWYANAFVHFAPVRWAEK